jgi:caa(3)-type oxidase subunit IV
MAETHVSGETRGEEALAGEHVGPGRRTYILIAVVLAVLTVIETTLPTLLKDNLTLLAYAVLTGTVLKAGLVALYYMHLKFDSKVYSAIVVLALLVIFYFLWLISYGHLGLVWEQ